MRRKEQKDIQTHIEKLATIATEVYATLGSGYLESIYKEALMVELRGSSIPYERERSVTIFYKGVAVGAGFADIVASPGGSAPIPIECKITALTEPHRDQLRTYMNGIGPSCKHGVLVRFPQPFKADGPPCFCWTRKNDDGPITFFEQNPSGEWVAANNKRAQPSTDIPKL